MLIVSPDREMVAPLCAALYINGYNEICYDQAYGNRTLGKYATKERTKQVLAEITEAYEVDTKVYYMPLKDAIIEDW